MGLLGKFYMTGGVTLTDTCVNTTEVWDPFTKSWTEGPEMLLPLFGHCVVKHRDSFIVIGGTISETSESNMIFSYKPPIPRIKRIMSIISHHKIIVLHYDVISNFFSFNE